MVDPTHFPPAPGRITTATVLSSHDKDDAYVPDFLEVEGRIYTGDRDQAELREILERSRLRGIITRAGPAVMQAYTQLEALDRDSYEKRCLAALRSVGRFLVNQREYDLLRATYLTLRERDETTDTIWPPFAAMTTRRTMNTGFSWARSGKAT